GGRTPTWARSGRSCRHLTFGRVVLVRDRREEAQRRHDAVSGLGDALAVLRRDVGARDPAIVLVCLPQHELAAEDGHVPAGGVDEVLVLLGVKRDGAALLRVCYVLGVHSLSPNGVWTSRLARLHPSGAYYFVAFFDPSMRSRMRAGMLFLASKA